MYSKLVDYREQLQTTANNKKAKTPDFTGVCGHYEML